jgi:hypothetical protein
VDLNLDTLKREILNYLDARDLAVFRSTPGMLDDPHMVLWDTEHFPDYRMFVDTAIKTGAKLILFAAREFQSDDIDELLEQLEETGMDRDQQREYQGRLRKLQIYEGMTCSLELAFSHDAGLYVYELQPDWYEDFLAAEDEIVSAVAEGDLDEGSSLGGYYSKN